MICHISCLISIVFIICMIVMNILVLNDKTIEKYKNQLSPELLKTYNEISKERMKISLYGYLIGFVISIFIIIYNYKIKENKLSTISIVCIVLSTSFITNYFFYTLYPKSKWMLDNIKDQQQTKAWLNMYKHMQLYYHLGFLFGIIGIGVLAFAFKC